MKCLTEGIINTEKKLGIVVASTIINKRDKNDGYKITKKYMKRAKVISILNPQGFPKPKV